MTIVPKLWAWIEFQKLKSFHGVPKVVAEMRFQKLEHIYGGSKIREMDPVPKVVDWILPPA